MIASEALLHPVNDWLRCKHMPALVSETVVVIYLMQRLLGKEDCLYMLIRGEEALFLPGKSCSCL